MTTAPSARIALPPAMSDAIRHPGERVTGATPRPLHARVAPSTFPCPPKVRYIAGRPAFFAQASSHASSQRRTSKPFKESVPTTEYITAVNRAPFSLSEPNDSRLPIAGPLSTLSARLLSSGTWGRSTKTHSPSR